MTILIHPTAVTSTPQIDADVLFRHPTRRRELEARPDGHGRVELHPITIAGIECLTDGDMLVRSDRLTAIDDSCAQIGRRIDGNLPGLCSALRAPLSTRRVRHRFDASIVCAIGMAGAGIAPLAGRQRHNMHAIVFAGEVVGLVAPLRTTNAASALGVVPGAVSEAEAGSGVLPGVPGWPSAPAAGTQMKRQPVKLMPPTKERS